MKINRRKITIKIKALEKKNQHTPHVTNIIMKNYLYTYEYDDDYDCDDCVNVYTI